MAKPTSVHSLPPELLLETFQHLIQLEPLGTLDYREDDDVPDAASPAGSFTSSSSDASVDDDYNISDESSSYSESLSFSYSLAWTRVTHVCNRWRTIALSTPSLWSSIPVNLCPDWVDELLRRSKQAQLDLIIPESHSDVYLTTLLSEMTIRRIRQIICENEDVPLLQLMGGSDAPGLEELDLAGIASPAINLNAYKALRRLNILLDDDDPTLIALLESIDLPSLTELRLAMASGTHSFSFSTQWSAIFENLTILDLDCVSFNLDGREEIELKRLRELSVVEDEEYCGSLIRRIRAPFLRKYDVRYLVPEYPAITDLAAVRAMGFARVLDEAAATIPALHTLTLTHFLSLFSALVEVHGWRFAGQDDNALEFPIHDTQMTPMDADISHGFDLVQTFKLRNFAVVLLSHPAFSTLRMLSVDLNPNLELGDTTTWVDLLRPMHQLQHLRISSAWNDHGCPLHILQALQIRERGGKYVASSMKRLTLVDWDPDNGRTPHSKEPVAGVVLRDIAIHRTRETSLQSIHIASWRRCYDVAWQSHLSEVDGVNIVYEHLFLSLDHVHATEELDPDRDVDTDTDDQASHTSTLILDHSGVPGYEPHLYQ
ncbi:hypothetical protein PENSPDRAFT_140736 [Peniophora sp. CONT]|nr:hypothetical protein PENSPDRAFT_140736 [Peniophora sp. CONT]